MNDKQRTEDDIKNQGPHCLAQRVRAGEEVRENRLWVCPPHSHVAPLGFPSLTGVLCIHTVRAHTYTLRLETEQAPPPAEENVLDVSKPGFCAPLFQRLTDLDLRTLLQLRDGVATRRL